MTENMPGGYRDGFLVVDKAWTCLSTRDSTPVSLRTANIRRRYKGIMGEAWPDEELIVSDLGGDEELQYDGLVAKEFFALVHDYYTLVSEIYAVDFLYCVVFAGWHDLPPISPPTSFVFYGYDYGYYLGAHNLFSAIYNDVIDGQYEALHMFEPRLNTYLLLSTLDDVMQLDLVRRQLIAENAFLEHDEDFEAIVIYGYEP